MASYQITHHSRYDFEHDVDGLILIACLTPYEINGQQCHYHKLVCQPPSASCSTLQDQYGNQLSKISVKRKTAAVQITSVSRVTSISYGEYALKSTPKVDWQSQLPAKEFILMKKRCQQFAADIMQSELPTRTKAERLCNLIHQQFKYCLQATDIHTSIVSLFDIRAGVCQDFARVMTAILRTYNIEAHYVSGYLYTGETKSANTITQPASHAWVSVNIGENMWCDIDPTNNCWVDERYISLARGPDYNDVVPVKGNSNHSVKQQLTVSVTIEPLLTKTA